jgi:hypothetical protein
MRQKYDRGSKWLIGKHADAILWLTGVQDVVTWRAVQAEIVQPRQLPDGLVEVRRAGQPSPSLYLIEIETYPASDITEQLLRDTLLAFLDRGTLPEVVVLVLYPKGNVQTGRSASLRSSQGWTQLSAAWRVVELWTLRAADLLASDDPGIVPWALLAQFEGAPEVLFQQCRGLIDRKAKPDEVKQLLATSLVLASLRYTEEHLLAILGGKQAMIESPLVREFVTEAVTNSKQEDILTILRARFEAVPAETEARLRTVEDADQLKALLSFAALCPDLVAFQARLLS